MRKTFEILGHSFVKSSYSKNLPFAKCVGVSQTPKTVLVTRLNGKNNPILKFTYEEWEAFIRGVKNGEFDVK